MATISLTCTNVLITDDSNKSITGTLSFDRTRGGTLIPPSGSSFPTTPVSGEYFWRTDTNLLYRRNNTNTTWDAISSAPITHGSTHISTSTDPIPNAIAGGASGLLSGTDKTKLDSSVINTRQVIAGSGLTGGGDLSADRTLNVGANADGSIVVSADDIGIGQLASDYQHGYRSGGSYHSAVTSSINGFMSFGDKNLLDADLPSADQKAALAGTVGTPSSSNKYVTNDDTRLKVEYHTVSVAPVGANFTSVAAAINSISGATATNQYAVLVYPGVYTEEPFSLKPYVCLRGRGGANYTVTIKTTDNHSHFITCVGASSIRDIDICGPTGDGCAAIYFNDNNLVPFTMDNSIIFDGYYGIFCNPSIYGVVQLSNIDLDNSNLTNTFIYTAAGSLAATSCSAATSSVNCVNGYVASGPMAIMTLDSCYYYQINGHNAIFLDNDAFVIASGCDFAKGKNAIHVGSIGTTTEVYANNCIFWENYFTWDVLADTPNCVICISGGNVRKDLISVPDGAKFIANFIDDSEINPGLVIYGELWCGTKKPPTIPLVSYTKANGNTGVAIGGEVTRVSGLIVNISDGYGFIDTGAYLLRVAWGSTNLPLTPNKSVIYVACDTNGIFFESFFVTSPINTLSFAIAATDASNVTILGSRCAQLSRPAASAFIYARDVIGPISVSGTAVSKYTSPSLQMTVDAGSYYIYNVTKTAIAHSPITFTYWYRDAHNNFVASVGHTAIDPDYYDAYNYGVSGLTTIPFGKFKRDLVYLATNGVGTEYHIIYGQEVYNAALLAINNPNPPGSFNNITLRLAGIIVQKGATDINTIADQRPKLGQLATTGTVITDHGSLSGLSDDDHAQYQLRSEKNTASGYCGLITGKVATTQLPFTVTPAVNVTRTSPSAGSSSEIARADHKHDIDVATPVTIDLTNLEGSSTSLARADHQHAHGEQTDGYLHARATELTHGFMDFRDKRKLDGVAANATDTPLAVVAPTNVTKDTAQIGSSLNVAKEDHRHNINTATPVTIDLTNLEGSSTSLARADHQHAHGEQTDGYLHARATELTHGFMDFRDKRKLDDVAIEATNTPLSSVSPYDITKYAANSGISSSASRADHKHDVGTTTPIDISTLNLEGSSVYLARADHQHDHGDQSDGYLHTRATELTHGFMDFRDKRKLDGVAANATDTPLAYATPVDVSRFTASVGFGLTAARSDHKHDIATATPVNISTSNLEGSSVYLARADHQHDHGEQSDGYLHQTATTGLPGFMDGTDKRKLNNLITNAVPQITQVIAGNGLTGGGALSTDVTLNIVSADGSITINANNIQVGTLVNDGQHGNLGNGSLHTTASHSTSGFISSTDKANLDFYLPSQDQKKALVGTYGTPSISNRYVTETDPNILTQENIVNVAKVNGDFTSVKAAVLSILDADITKPYVVRVAPGIYDEDPFTMKPYVNVIGLGRYFYSVVLRTNYNSNHFITGVGASSLIDIDLVGPTTPGYAAINFIDNSYIPFTISGCLISDGYYGVWCHPTVFGIVSLTNCATFYKTSTIERFLYSSDHGTISAISCGATDIPSSVKYGYYTYGPNTEMGLDSCNFAIADGVAIFANNGSIVRARGCSLTSAKTGFHIGSMGTGTLIQATGCIIDVGVVNNVIIDTSTAIMTFSGGTLNKDLLYLTPGAVFTAEFTDITTGQEGFVVFGEIWLGSDGTGFPMGSYFKQSSSTGLASGGEVSRVSGLIVSIAEGYGYINNDTTLVKKSWLTTPLTLPANKQQLWISVDFSGAIVATTYRPNENITIRLATTSTDASSVIALATYSQKIQQVISQKFVYARDVVGPISVNGCGVTKHAVTSLQLDADAGTYYIYDNLKTAVAHAPITFSYWYRGDSHGNWTPTSGHSSIDPDYYDAYNYGVSGLTLVPSGKFKRDLLFAEVNGTGTEYHIIYGQEVYNTALLAINNPNPPDVLNETSLRLAATIVQRGAIDITTITNQRPKLGQLSAAGTAVTTHGQLSGLNTDDHKQYQLRSEKNTVSGYCGLNSSTLVDATYLPFTSTPPVNVAKSSPSYGASSEIARADHKHDIDVAIPITINTSNLEGSSSSLARADHQHAHGDQTDGYLHAMVTTLTHGFLGFLDKRKLNGIATNATNTPLAILAPANVTKAAAQIGGSSYAAKEDHKHDITTDIPVDIGAANSEGAATTLARSNHVHNHGTQTDGYMHALVTTLTHGFLGFLDKRKLNSLITNAVPNTIQVIAGAGLTGGGDLSANRTINVIANADNSITVNADDIQVGILATDAQHGNRGNGSLHTAATTIANGFMASGDKSKLDGIAAGATNTPLAITAPEDVTKATATIGASSTAAKSDHKHDISTNVPVNIGAANAEGAATSLARSNHVHAHGNQTDGYMHAMVTTLTHGFLGFLDKRKLDGIATNATNTPLAITAPADVTKATAGIGSSPTAAKSDHKHDISTAAPAVGAVAIGNTAAEGAATSLARSDHTHTVTSGTAVDVGTGNTAGSAATFSRSDHVHAGLTRNANDFSTFTEKTTPIAADLLLIEDSAAVGVKKRLQITNLSSFFSVFGANRQYVADETETNTSSSTMETKVTLTTPALTGTYHVEYYCEMEVNAGNNHNYAARLYNSTNAAELCYSQVRTAIPLLYGGVTGFAIVTFAGAAKTFLLQFASPDNTTQVNIRRARVEIWRVA